MQASCLSPPTQAGQNSCSTSTSTSLVNKRSRYPGPYNRLRDYSLTEGSFALLSPQTTLDEILAHGGVDFVLLSRRMPRYANGTMRCLAIALFIASLLGTSLRVYCSHKDTGDITPCSVDRPSADCVFLPDFLEGEWDLDILSPAGFNRMQEISAYVKAEVANIEEL